MSQNVAKFVTAFAFLSISGCSILGGSETSSVYVGKPADEVSVNDMSGELEESFSIDGYDLKVRPITRPLTIALARADLGPKHASKKKINEKALLYSAIFVDGYTCFDFSLKKPEDNSTKFAWGAFRFSYGYQEGTEKVLITRSVPHFERQRQALITLLQKHLPLADCEKNRCERQVFCGEHIHFTRPFRLKVTKGGGKESSEVASAGWAGDPDSLASRPRRSQRLR